MSSRARPSTADLEQRVEELSRQLAEGQRQQAEADRQVARLRRDLAEAVEREAEGLARETATSEILRVISSSPTDLQPVLDAITQSAARLCSSESALLRRIEGDVVRVASAYGTPIPGLEVGTAAPLDRRSGTARAVVERRTIHIHDAAAVSDDDLPETRATQRVGGY
jgi:cell division septum initiation protein DivIVA